MILRANTQVGTRKNKVRIHLGGNPGQNFREIIVSFCSKEMLKSAIGNNRLSILDNEYKSFNEINCIPGFLVVCLFEQFGLQNN